MAKEALRPDVQAAADQMPTKLGAGKYLKKLTEQLVDGETVEQLALAQQDKRFGLLVATDRRLLFLFKLGFSSSSEDVPYSRISTVSTGSGMAFGEFTVHAQGRDVRFHDVEKAAAQRIVNTVRAGL